MVVDLIDISKPINKHSFTHGWLIKSLRKNDKEFQRRHEHRGVKNIQVVCVSEGQGFYSLVYRCTIIFVDSLNPTDTYSTVLKIPVFQEATTKICNENLTEAHQFECDFYNELAPILGIPLPKVYKTIEWIYGQQEGCIHMEDLSIRGKCLYHFDSVNLAQVKCFIRHLAHMHKNILVANPKLWKGKFLQNNMRFADFLKNGDARVDNFLVNCKRQEAFLPLIQKYRKFLTNIDYVYYANCQLYKDLQMAPVLVHGDIFAGNIMWATNAHGDADNEIAAIIDWQVMHEGSPMTDLSCFLVFCCDGVTRRQAEIFAIEYYLECLKQEFGGDAFKLPYSASQLQEAYDIVFITHALHTIGLGQLTYKGLERKIDNARVRAAYYDAMVAKALHAWEDVDNLFQGAYKNLYDQFE